jgi:hypothetical protein
MNSLLTTGFVESSSQEMSVRDFLKDLDGGLRYLETLVRDHLVSVMDGNQNDPFEG